MRHCKPAGKQWRFYFPRLDTTGRSPRGLSVIEGEEMITFKIINPPAGAISWLIDIETGGAPVFAPVTVGLTSPISMSNAPIGSSVEVFFLAYADPVGTSATGTTIWKGSQNYTGVLTDGLTLTMDMSTGDIIGNSATSKVNWPVLIGVAAVSAFLLTRKK